MSKAIAVLIAAEAVLVIAGTAFASMQIMPAKTAMTAAEAKAPINACALLSRKDVEAAVGKKVNEGQRHDEGLITDNPYVSPGTYSSTCLWRVIDPDFFPDPSLPLNGQSFAILNAMQWPDGPEGAHRFLQGFHDAARDNMIDNEPVAVQIDDEALWWGDGVAGRKRDRSYGISVHLAGDSKPQEQAREEDLARKIAPRL